MKILDSRFEKSAVKPSQYGLHEFSDIAFSGKSNVGKSSLINTLLGRKKLAKTSSTPGKTRLINFFQIRAKIDEENEAFFNIVDLPGYGYARVSKTERDSWQKMMSDYFTQRIQLRGVVALVDIRHKADPKDIGMIEMLKAHQIPFVVVATKADKIAKSKIPKTLKALKQGLGLAVDDKIIAISSLKKTGFESVLSWIQDRLF